MRARRCRVGGQVARSPRPAPPRRQVARRCRRRPARASRALRPRRRARLAHRAAIASNIFDGSTVLKTSDGFSVTSAMSVRRGCRHLLARHQARELHVGQAVARDARSRSASSSAPSPTMSTAPPAHGRRSCAGGREHRAEAVRHPNRPDVAGQDVVVSQAELGARVLAVRRLPERRHDAVRNEVQLRRVDPARRSVRTKLSRQARRSRWRRDTSAARAVRAAEARTIAASRPPRESTPATGPAARRPTASAARACTATSPPRRRTAARCRSATSNRPSRQAARSAAVGTNDR